MIVIFEIGPTGILGGIRPERDIAAVRKENGIAVIFLRIKIRVSPIELPH